MESFRLLKYWRAGTGFTVASNMHAEAATAATPLPESPPQDPETDSDDDTDDEGPFFDLEFGVADGNDAEGEGEENNDENDDLEGLEDDKDFNFTMEESEFRSMSPSDDLFFKGQLVPLETNSIVIASAAAESDPKPHLSAVSFLKSATKYRVLMLGLRKPKSTVAELNEAAPAEARASPKQSKFFVKFKVEEVPIISLFTRDGSSRNSAGGAKPPAEEPAAVDEKKSSNSKEVVQRYLSKIRPLYIRVSKRYADKLRFSGPLVPGGMPAGEEKKEEAEEPAAAAAAPSSCEKIQKPAIPARLRVVYERLGKIKSASSAVASVSSPPQRRDDSMLQQQDGIQSAIAHCKRSFTAASKETESPLLVRSKSDPSADCV